MSSPVSFWKTTENIKRVGQAQPTTGAPTDTPSVQFGHPLRYDPATKTLFIWSGVVWDSIVLT